MRCARAAAVLDGGADPASGAMTFGWAQWAL
jgi:hypothetical protein